ncbi:sodium:solute symporter family protein [Segeticoccus rhizosphaerae]|uniref:sodium:solute symporter family protein n=1 Tax=Segeticoccus rhizosphaerae TaxID=1104777 RepID=UPI001265651F|nr:sodium:solute symporter family protein [Segeticoccus rhizosphaerae]
MTGVGAWTIALALGYTLFLVGAGRIARRRESAGRDFFAGGRRFRPITVAFCITGLFSGSSFIAILELSYHTGVSALWYGVAESVQVLLIAGLLVVPFREQMVVTISGLIGERFGRLALGVGGAITAFTFPMWSVATAIAFASALHAFTGLSIQVAIVCTALLLLFYLWSGGMWSIAFTQTANCVVFALMLALGAAAFLINPGPAGLADLAAARPEMFAWTGVGMPLIVAWFGTFIVNVILAQAALQMALSCRTPEAGRKGLIYAVGFGMPFILLGVVFGLAAALVVPGQTLGLIGVPLYIAQVLPAPLAAVFFLGIWACALGWGGPCQFSGATSLGRDVGRAIRPAATEADLVGYTRRSLVLLTALMITFGFLRTEQSAWWNVLAWTLRNGATLAPVLAALFWPLATRRAVVAAMGAGFTTGLAWYQLGGWQPDQFYLGIHPVWVGMTVNLVAMVTITLIESHGAWTITPMGRRRTRGLWTLTGAIAAGSTTLIAWAWLQDRGLGGLSGFATVTLAAAALFQLLGPTTAAVLPQDQHKTTDQRS